MTRKAYFLIAVALAAAIPVAAAAHAHPNGWVVTAWIAAIIGNLLAALTGDSSG